MSAMFCLQTQSHLTATQTPPPHHHQRMEVYVQRCPRPPFIIESRHLADARIAMVTPHQRHCHCTCQRLRCLVQRFVGIGKRLGLVIRRVFPVPKSGRNSCVCTCVCEREGVTMSSSQMSNGIINTVFITNIVTVNIRNYCVCFRLGKKEQEERCR